MDGPKWTCIMLRDWCRTPMSLLRSMPPSSWWGIPCFVEFQCDFQIFILFIFQSLSSALTITLIVLSLSLSVFLSPLLLRSLWMGVFMLNGLLRAKVPSVHQKVGHYLKPILQRMGWFNERIALMEVFVGIFLIFAMFFMSRTVILCFVYWQIMHARYMMDYQIQCAFRTVHSKIQSLLSRVPFLLNLYLKMTGYLWNMVDPQRLQQQMQSGGAGSGLGGLMSKCNIMWSTWSIECDVMRCNDCHEGWRSAHFTFCICDLTESARFVFLSFSSALNWTYRVIPNQSLHIFNAINVTQWMASC